MRNLIIIFLAVTTTLTNIFAADSNCKWIHYKGDVSIGKVMATLNGNRLVANEIKSNPYRAKVCGARVAEVEKELLKDQYVLEMENTDTPQINVPFHSAFGFTLAQRDTWTKAYIIAVPTVLTIFGAAAWDWGKEGVNFGFGNEGWFDKDSYTGGADKVGHMTSLYIEKRFATWLLTQMGHDRDTAQRYGFYTASFIAVALEVGDGMSKYKFSTEDLFMDYVGIFLAWMVDEYPWLDELIGIRWEWWPSSDYRSPRNKAKLDITSDYTGQKVFFSIKSAGIPYLREQLLTRYLTLDFGFYTRGYEPDLTPDTFADNITSRHYSVGLGINLGTLIFDTKPTSTAVRTAGSITKYWIPPGVSQAVYTKDL